MRLKILLLLLPFLTLKDGNSLTVALSIPPPPEESGVEWSGVECAERVGRNRCKLFGPPIFLGGGALFGGTASLLISNSKCGHLEAAKSFIHWSDCETRRWSEALTVTS